MGLQQNRKLLLIADTRLDCEAYTSIVRHNDPLLEVRGCGFELTNICDELRATPAITIIVAERITMDVKAIVGMVAKVLPSTRILLIVGAGVDNASRTPLLAIVTSIIEKQAFGAEELSQAIRSTQRGETTNSVFVSHQTSIPSVANSVRDEITLSPRERDLLPLLASGLKLREAADHLNISYKTADAYRTRIFQKLGISNRSELIRFAIRNSMINL